MKSEKMKSLSEAKQRYGFPKKFHGNIYNSVFSEKKIKFQKFCSHGFLWLQSVKNVLRFGRRCGL